jgi:hypothetical protein
MLGAVLSIIGYFKASLASAYELFISSLRKKNNQEFYKKRAEHLMIQGK